MAESQAKRPRHSDSVRPSRFWARANCTLMAVAFLMLVNVFVNLVYIFTADECPRSDISARVCYAKFSAVVAHKGSEDVTWPGANNTTSVITENAITLSDGNRTFKMLFFDDQPVKVGDSVEVLGWKHQYVGLRFSGRTDYIDVWRPGLAAIGWVGSVALWITWIAYTWAKRHDRKLIGSSDNYIIRAAYTGLIGAAVFAVTASVCFLLMTTLKMGLLI